MEHAEHHEYYITDNKQRCEKVIDDIAIDILYRDILLNWFLMKLLESVKIQCVRFALMEATLFGRLLARQLPNPSRIV